MSKRWDNTDEIGSEVKGALKNLIALARGVFYGVGDGKQYKSGVDHVWFHGNGFGGMKKTFMG